MDYFNKTRLKLSLIGIPIIGLFLFFIIAESVKSTSSISDSYKDEEYSGKIIEKYIDRKEHNFKKVIIDGEYRERTILFNHETGGLYDFFRINDSVIKVRETLDIRIIREDCDTIIKMKFE